VAAATKNRLNSRADCVHPAFGRLRPDGICTRQARVQKLRFGISRAFSGAGKMILRNNPHRPVPLKGGHLRDSSGLICRAWLVTDEQGTNAVGSTLRRRFSTAHAVST
jgi:hypothetical protein